jgi:Cys-tRNA(Pro)/Cys-tRNA(Cys) deacylase
MIAVAGADSNGFLGTIRRRQRISCNCINRRSRQLCDKLVGRVDSDIIFADDHHTEDGMKKSNDPPTPTPVTRFLDEKGIGYRFFQHPGAVHSLEQAADERGQRVDQIIRSIVFRLSRGGFVMVLVAGKKQVSWQALRRHLGTSRISMATEEEVLEITGYSLGAVSPFGIKQPLHILVDQDVLNENEISVGSGVRYSTVIMRCDDFMLTLGQVEVGNFAQTERFD